MIADPRVLSNAVGLARRVVEETSVIDILIAHLALPAPATSMGDVDDEL